MGATTTDTGIDLNIRDGDGVQTMVLRGRLDAPGISKVWAPAIAALTRASPRRLVIDAAGISYLDGAGLGLFIELERRQIKHQGSFEIQKLAPDLQHIVGLVSVDKLRDEESVKVTHSSVIEDVGRGAVEAWRDIVELIVFVGELTVGVLRVAAHPGRLRWRDAFLTMELAGANALPIVAMIGFLIGLIMAFQSATSLSRFGAEIFVADLVSLSVIRELGPFVTAIILAGRSGSAFAAELGTMKVNEEINALETMGLDPVPFLVVPRVIAAVLIMPFLALFFDLMSLVGGAIVMLSLDYPLITYFNRIVQALDLWDIFGGLIKAVAFGILVAAIGCLRGLQTKTGASAVGDSTTRAVVSGIVLIAVSDGVFSVMFYVLGI